MNLAVPKFAFIVHPLNEKEIPRGKKPAYLETPDLICRIEGRSARCLGLVVPRLPVDFIQHEKLVEMEIREAIRAAEDWGAQIIGLGGFTSIIGDGGRKFLDGAQVPLTSGNTLTAAIIIKSVLAAATQTGLDIRTSRIVVIGATGDIGSACCRALAGYCESMVLVARNEERLHRLQDELLKINGAVYVEKKAARAAASSDVVITVTSSITTLLEPADLKSGAIVCDGAYPANIAREVRHIRKDILVYEGGIVSWSALKHDIPQDHPFWRFNLPIGVHACFAETLLLALEEMFVTFSIGRGNITKTSMDSMSRLAEKYGVTPAGYWHGQGEFSSENIKNIRQSRIHAETTRLNAS